MRILLTNDDGLHAVGIRRLHEALCADGSHEVLCVAPASVQSACSHALTFDRPLRISREPLENPGGKSFAPPGSFEGIAVHGSPADCVKLTVEALWPERFGPGTRPQLVLSGINLGSNGGVNHHYSGTVAAAREGSILGIPSIAFSQTLAGGTPLWETSARWSLEVLTRLLAGPLEAAVSLSVNLPPAESEAPTPVIQVRAMNVHRCEDRYERRWDPRGGEYYWPVGDGPAHCEVDVDSDVAAVDAGCISVTPLGLDATSYPAMEAWKTALSGG